MAAQLYLLTSLLGFILSHLHSRSGEIEADSLDPARMEADQAAGCTVPLLPAVWLQEAGQEIARSEYFYSTIADGACSAPNRAQDLRSRIGLEGIEIFPRVGNSGGVDASWKLTLITVGFGHEGDVRPIGEPRLTRYENRVERHAVGLSEWYVNDERGIEQGWTIPAPPPGLVGRFVRIQLAAAGLERRVAADGLSAVFLDEESEIRVRYLGLRTWDASGCELASRLVSTAAGLAVELEAQGALYPVTVDPVLTGPVWTAESDQEDSDFGFCVSGAGDVNGDGFDDVIVGASQFYNPQFGEGRSFLYLGSAGGPSIAPDWTAEGNQAWAHFGWSVSGAGDVNGDGFDDVIVGAYAYDNGRPNEGRSSLYFGSASGPSLVPDWTAEGDQLDAWFGWSVSGAGDVNGDGFDDVIVGAFGFDNGEDEEGRSFLFLGSAGGPSLTPAWTAESDQPDARFGCSVSGAGDVNGDGFDDVIVGAHRFENGQSNEGRSFLYLGSACGPSAAPYWTSESDQAGALFGWSVSGAGDVNGDGLDDVLVGAHGFNHDQVDEGRAFLYIGQAYIDCNGNGVDDTDDIADGTSQDSDGNGIPDECETIGTKYCASTTNSTGAAADISASGSACAAAGALTIEASPVPNQSGSFFHGANQIQVPFGNGFNCVAGNVKRGAMVFASGNLASYTYDNSDAQHDLSAHAGTNRNFQYWHRDPMGGGAQFNTSNAIAVEIVP